MKSVRLKLFKQLFLSSISIALGGSIERRMAKIQTLFRRLHGRMPFRPNDLLFQLQNNQHRSDEYVPVPTVAPSNTGLRCIAFYLPQFHPIPENDQWWGKGFTEWTNVSKAYSEFKGHVQPQRPGELGFYDLRSDEIQRRQSELATMHGIHGFCYYFYWFDGHTLLESPLKARLADLTNRHPFCLCWANENWTRRWDGHDQHVLMSQVHTPEDDLKFIAHIADYLRDERYIRVNGKPLLVVYRPALLPDPAATAQRWREYCRQHGIGELYLVNVQSLDRMDPRHIGFDAAIDFAPNNRIPVDITTQVQPFRSNYGGKVFDYRAMVRESYRIEDTPHTVFQSCCPSWDNTPRRQNTATVFHHSSPAAYQEWLENICEHTLRRLNQDEQLVFINAWNEWGEGAMLEPSQRQGYAYLNATAKALASVQSRQQTAAPRLGVIVHAYYAELWPEIAARLRQWDIPFKLYVSTTEAAIANLSVEIHRDWPNAIIEALPNRGRDIAPFLHFLPQALNDGVELICKVHTKKSVHRSDGEAWRKDLYDKLLGHTQGIRQMVTMFNTNAALGLIAPKGHIAPITLYWGGNRNTILTLAKRMGYDGEFVPRAFIAGSMFWVRCEALRALLSLGLTADDFEEEAGQVDGTLAHAVERLFTLSAKMGGFRMTDTTVANFNADISSGLRSDLELASIDVASATYSFANAPDFDVDEG